MKKILISAAALVSLTAIIAAWIAQGRAEEARGSRATLLSERVQRLAELRGGEAKIATARREQAALQARINALQNSKLIAGSASAAPSGESSVAATSADAPTSEQEAQRKEREAIARAKGEMRSLADDRLAFATVYQSLFRSLQLSPEQIDRFLAISARQHERVMDLGQMEREGRIAKGDPAVAKIRAEGVAAEHAEYRALLGEAGYRQFIDDQKETSARQIVGSFGGHAVLAGMPLSANRLEQLVEAIASAHIPDAGWRQADGRYAQWQFDPIDWDRADARVRPLLSEAEWALYKTQVDRSNHRLRTLAWQAKAADAARNAAAAAKPQG